MDFAVSWIFLVAGTLASIVIGALWYSPVLFAKPWMASLGLNEGDVEQSGVSAVPGYLASTLYSIALAYLIGVLASNLADGRLRGYLLVAVVLWLVTSGLANLRIKYFEDRPWTLYAVDEGYAVVVHLVVAVLAWLLR